MAVRRHPSDIPDARLQAVLEKYVPPIIARSILERARREAISGPKVSWTDPNGLLDRIAVGVKTYGEPDEVPAILREISDLALSEREDGPVSHSFDGGPASSMKPSAAAAAAGALTAAARSSRDEPATRREPALGPPSSGSSPRRDGAAASWSVGSPPASPTSSTPHAAASAWSAGPPPASPPTHAATGAGWSGGAPTSPSAANLDASPASRREHDLGLPPRRAVDAPSASRGVFSTAGPRSSPTGASGGADTSAGAARVQIVRDGRPVPPAPPYAPPAATATYSSGTARSSPTPPAGMPRVPPTTREGSLAAAPRAPVQGLLPKAPGRIEITHASVPRPPPVPSRADIGIAMPRPQPKENAPKEVTITLASEHDIPLARQIARDICERLGTRALTQQRLLTIVSELGRNMVLYAGGGKMTLRPPTVKSRRIVVIAVDQGTGIPNLPEIMAGKYKSRSGLGLGLLGTKRLADSFNVETGRAGTTVSVEVIL